MLFGGHRRRSAASGCSGPSVAIRAAALVAFVVLVAVGARADASSGPLIGAAPGTASARQAVGSDAARGWPALRITDLSFLTAQEGWVLATERCGHPPCTVVAHTRDGGRTWRRIPAPKAYLWDEDLCVTKQHRLSPCIEELRFATPQLGYAFGPEFFTTSDGGHSWQQEKVSTTLALAAGGGYVIRVTEGTGVDDDLVQRESVASPGEWVTLLAHLRGSMQTLVVDGVSVFVVRNVDYGQEIYRSLDNGATWSRLSSPCAAGGTAITDAAHAAGSHLAILCTDYPTTAYVRTSSDNGTTFGPERPVPLVPNTNANVYHIAAASANVLAVSDDNDHVHLSTDGGRTWRVALWNHDLIWSRRELGLAYQDARTAHVIQPPDRVARTTDQGRHWKLVQVQW